MSSPAEQEAGITYAEVGIDTSQDRWKDKMQVHCPRCRHQRKPEHQKERKLALYTPNGTWRCHHCGWVSGLGAEAVKKNGRTAAFAPGGPRMSKPVAESKPIKSAAPVALSVMPTDKPQWMYDWFRDRRLSRGTVDAFGCTAKEWTDERGTHQEIHFPYLVDDKLVNVKRRRISAEGGKAFGLVADADKSLYNIDAAEHEDVVVVVEGEPDCLACFEAGWIAVSPPNGAPGKRVDEETGEITVAAVGAKLDAFYEAKSARVLAQAKRIIVATDGDPEGQKLRDGIVEHLGVERCWVVTWPAGCKDANDVLVKLGHEALDEALESARPVDEPGITSFADEYAALRHIWEHGYDDGISTGWAGFDELFKVMPGSTIVLSGVPGNSKTSWTLALFTQLAHTAGMKFGVFSPEAGNNGTLLGKLVQMVSDRPILPGTPDRISEDELKAAAEWVAQRFWRIDAAGTAESEYGQVGVPEIIRRLERLVLRHGINGAIIDPWNRLESARPNGMLETEYVAWAINQFSRFAKRHNVALFVVAHPTKMAGCKYGEEEPIPSPYDIAGSAHWYAMADYILGFGRNKYTEPRNRTTVQVQKVREEGVGGNLGTAFFYYDGRSRRFYMDETELPAKPGASPYMQLKPRRPQPGLPIVSTAAD